MSAHELPEDLSRWPSDAYELLGVARGVDPRDLRRAYTRLIRTYKPEQFPEHFRRIREAYETVLQYADLFGHLEVSSAPELESILTNRERDDRPPPAPAEPEESPTVPRPYRPPEVPELWQIACDGDSATAYRRLMQLDDTEPGRTDVCLAAYWLLILEPELDTSREPCDWLARGLETAGLAGPLRELYRREIADNPQEALSDRCTRLIHSAAPPGLVADLIEWRWRAAARLKRLASFVPPDLDSLRHRIAREDEETWLRLLLIAAGLLANAPARETRSLYLACQKEIETYQHLHNRLAVDFDQYELQMEVAEKIVQLYWAKQPNLTRVGELVESAQNQHFIELRPQLLSFLEKLTEKPARVLRCFDHVRKLAPAVLAEFGNLIQQLADSVPGFDDDRNLDDYAELVGTFLAKLSTTEHETFRLELLNFCLREAISPQQAADSIDGHDYPALSQQVRDDWPLQHAWLACHVMRN